MDTKCCRPRWRLRGSVRPRLDGRIELLRALLAQRVARPAGLAGVPIPEAQPRPDPKRPAQAVLYKIQGCARNCWSARCTKRRVLALISLKALSFDMVPAGRA